MRVFKGYFKIIKKNWVFISIYFCIFLALGLGGGSLKNGTQKVGFSERKLEIVVIDRESGDIGKGVIDYVKKNHIFIELEDDKEVLQEALFYKQAEYILIVPEDAEKRLLEGKTVLQTTKITSADISYYADAELQTFLNHIRTYMTLGYDTKEAVLKAQDICDVQSKVVMNDRNGNSGRLKAYVNYLGVMPYLMIGVLSCSLGVVLIEFKKIEIRQRMAVSSVSLKRQNIEAVLAVGVIGVGLWIGIHVVGRILYGKEYFSNTHVMGYLLNTFVLMLVSLSIAFLGGAAVKSVSAINAFTNVVSLGLSFLGGVFVPIELLADDIKKIGQFLPTYWYSQNTIMLGSYRDLPEELAKTFGKGILIQLLFAAACVSLSLAVHRYRVQE